MAKPKTPPIEIMEISCQKRVIVLSCDRFEWRHTDETREQKNILSRKNKWVLFNF